MIKSVNKRSEIATYHHHRSPWVVDDPVLEEWVRILHRIVLVNPHHEPILNFVVNFDVNFVVKNVVKNVVRKVCLVASCCSL